MPSLRDIRRRIRGVRNTAKITKAMQMVAASRMRRAQQRAQESRPYAEAIGRMVSEVAHQRGDPSALHPLQRRRPENHAAFLVFTSDRGLAGPLNSNVLRRASAEMLARSDSPDIVTVGRKGQDFFSRRGHALLATFTGLGARAEYADVIPVARVLTAAYSAEQIDAIYLIYPEFVTTMTQRPVVNRLLPLGGAEEAGPATDFIIEPDPEQILSALLPRYVEVQIYRALLETTASEHSARMVAMRSATDNAEEIVRGLTLTYNKARQAAITKEISEISSAAEAMAKAG
ncbi:MAG: ATP synthase F1 subunit gamma [Chloroflexi bacterium]|nr:ATP synthase F1 subunit gamma [Chloroflexota bacterium]